MILSVRTILGLRNTNSFLHFFVATDRENSLPYIVLAFASPASGVLSLSERLSAPNKVKPSVLAGCLCCCSSSLPSGKKQKLAYLRLATNSNASAMEGTSSAFACTNSSFSYSLVSPTPRFFTMPFGPTSSFDENHLPSPVST